MYDAFISYSRKDLPDVERLKNQLAARRLRPFLDTTSLRSGEDWPPQLGVAIQNSRLLVLCWSQHSASSDWVKAEINHGLSAKKPGHVLPWLLDDTPLPPLLQRTHGIKNLDPTPVTDKIAACRSGQRLRTFLVSTAVAAVLGPAVWFASQQTTPQTTDFRGHIIDEQNNPIDHVTIEADGKQTTTNTSGRFSLNLPGPPVRRALRVEASKPGYQTKSVDTQTDVPDLGLILEKLQ